jgi:alpha-tubulin suppressor-like RCC1 family protein
VPVAVAGLTEKRITAISAGNLHSWGIADSRAYCWGWNGRGQLGNGSVTDSSVPVAVAGLTEKTVTAISAGYSHSCAVADGRAYCWGNNEVGQLGDNSNTNSPVPVAVAGLTDKTVTAISAGGAHSCAVADGQAYCWGYNGDGRLGNNSNTDSPVPVAVAGLTDKTVTAISAGGAHSCAVLDGQASCWGQNFYGQLGNNSNTNSPVPVAVTGLAGKTVTAISAGAVHSCAVLDGQTSCWGWNYYGQLGNNSNTNSSVPVAVTGLNGTVTLVSAGYDHSCAVAAGRAYCWGSNNHGELGIGTTDDSQVPMAVDTAAVLAGRTVTAIAAGNSHTSAISAAAPQQPTGVSGVADDGRVAVSWAAPADDGGAVIEEYAATATPGGATCTASTTSCTVTGLANGTAYTFTVTARNAFGVSAPSGPSVAVTPQAPTSPPPPTQPPVQQPPVQQAPAKVTGVKASVGKGKVKITWESVAGATSYGIRISKPGGTKYLGWKTTTKRMFKAKLKKGEKYRFQVAAVAAGGRGPVTTIRFKGR